MPLPKSISLGFDFYGSGNIGDDLMLAGFLQGLSQVGSAWPALHGRSRFPLGTQQTRFPEITWVDTAAAARKPADPEACWAGVGDTPFQLTSGPWFLEYSLEEL